MKHAFLIETHQFTHVLETLIRMIDDERNDIFVHIDKKVKRSYADKIAVLVKKSELHFVKRVKVYWGHISQVKAEYALFQEAFENAHYSYYHLISGSDLPIKTQDDIHSFFDKNQGKEFISFSKDAQPERVLYRWPFPKHLRGLCSDRKWIYRKIVYLQDVITKGYIDFQKAIRWENKAFLVYKKGTNWVSLTEEAVRILLENKHLVLRSFRCANCPDEHYKQTILFNYQEKYDNRPSSSSKSDYVSLHFSDEYVNEKNVDVRAARFVDWSGGHLHNLTIEDWDRLERSQMMFCRKVTDDKLADKIFERFGPK